MNVLVSINDAMTESPNAWSGRVRVDWGLLWNLAEGGEVHMMQERQF